MIPHPLDAEEHADLARALRDAPSRRATDAERAWIRERTPRGSDWDALLALLDTGALTVCHRPELDAPVLLSGDRVVLATPQAGPEVLAGAFAAHLVAPAASGRAAFAAARLEALSRGRLGPDAPVDGQGSDWTALARWRLVDDPDRVALPALLRALDAAPEPTTPQGWWGWLRHRVERGGPLPSSFRDLPLPTFAWRDRLLPRVDAPAPELRPDDVFDAIAEQADGARPLVLGVFGPAAAGKSTFCRSLVRALRRRGVRAVSLGGDRFLWPGPGFRYTVTRGRRTTRIRGPAVYDHAGVARALTALRAGRTVALPADPHERRPPARVAPAPVVVVDGVFLACDPDVRALLDVPVALCVPDALRLERKWRRDAGPTSTHRRDVVRDFVEKQLVEVTDGVLPTLSGPVLRVDASGEPLR